MNTIEVLPDPVSLIESMRAVGYTLEAAIADLIDNSISAEADMVEVAYDASADPFVAILDNGEGMTARDLLDAMRHGSKSPKVDRKSHDLGRFGLGLKTASLSQCQRLTVVSKRESRVAALCWDLSVVRRTKKWAVVQLSTEEMKQLPLFDKLQSQVTGTLVVWQDLDRLIAGSRNPQAEMTNKFAPLLEHLALVFHRFREKEGNDRAVQIAVNGLKLPLRDPFLRANSHRQPLEGQVIRHEKGDVVVTPFLLPPISHLSPEEIDLAGGKEGLRGTQGFYVYRARRLVMWGTWFQLVQKDEFFKLTRVQVDIPNSFDELWALDIKKSSAYPPDIIRTRLKELIPHFTGKSRETVTYPGRKTGPTGFVPLWQRVEPRRGAFRYDLNLAHPAIVGFSSRLDSEGQRNLQSMLEMFAASIPFESIYADMCSDDRKQDEDALVRELVEIAATLQRVTGMPLTEVMNIDPLVRHPDLHALILEELEE